MNFMDRVAEPLVRHPDVILYCRVKSINKDWLDEHARGREISTAMMLDILLDMLREDEADGSNTTKSKRSPGKARR